MATPVQTARRSVCCAQAAPAPDHILLTVPEAADLLRIGRSLAWKMVSLARSQHPARPCGASPPKPRATHG